MRLGALHCSPLSRPRWKFGFKERGEMSERRPSMQSRAVSASYKLTGTHASQHLFRKVWLELRQRLAVYCDARLRLLDEPQHRRTRGLDDRCDLCRLTATPNHELGGSVDAPRCAGEHPRKAAGQIWGQKRELNPSAARHGSPEPLRNFHFAAEQNRFLIPQRLPFHPTVHHGRGRGEGRARH